MSTFTCPIQQIVIIGNLCILHYLLYFEEKGLSTNGTPLSLYICNEVKCVICGREHDVIECHKVGVKYSRDVVSLHWAPMG